jgi:nicotinamidase-related amidase
VKLDPGRTALVLVDLMPRIVGLQTAPHSGDTVLAGCLRMADAFRAVYAPVVTVRVERPNVAKQPPGSELVPAVAERGDVEVVKRSWGAYGTNLNAAWGTRHQDDRAGRHRHQHGR